MWESTCATKIPSSDPHPHPASSTKVLCPIEHLRPVLRRQRRKKRIRAFRLTTSVLFQFCFPLPLTTVVLLVLAEGFHQQTIQHPQIACVFGCESRMRIHIHVLSLLLETSVAHCRNLTENKIQRATTNNEPSTTSHEHAKRRLERLV